MPHSFNLRSGKMACYHHPEEQSVALCKECGKGICKDCFDTYASGIGSNKALCFDCVEERVQQNIAEVDAFRSKVKRERTWMIVGAVLGAILIGPMLASIAQGEVLAAFIMWSLGVFGGASLGTIISGFKEYGWVVGIIMIVISPIMSIVRYVKRLNQIKECDAIISSDARFLREMRDYFEYTFTRAKNVGVDLASLMSSNGALFDNTYAQEVYSKGESAAAEGLRLGLGQVAANGEIIRNF